MSRLCLVRGREVKDSEYSEGLWRGFLKQRATGHGSETTDGKGRSQTGQS